MTTTAKKHSRSLIAAMAAALAPALLFAAPSQPQTTGGEAGESIRGFSFAIVEESSQKSIVEGTKADMESENTLAMTDVVCSIYQNSVLSLAIKTPRASADMDNGMVTSSDMVTFTNPKGMSITGTGMRWDTKSRQVTVLRNIDSVFPSTMFAEDTATDENK